MALNRCAAQTLQRLTVESFTLTADTTRPRIDAPFHIVVTLHVLQHVTEIDNLELPMLAQLEFLGDERQIVSGSRDTQYREVITVVAHAAGTIPIAPATLQAVDARDSRAKQWFTNSLDLRAGIGADQILRSSGSALLAGAIVLFRIFLVLVGIGCIVLLGIVLVRRANRVPPAAPEPNRRRRRRASTAQRLNDALVVLRAERTRQAAVRVRGVVWQHFRRNAGRDAHRRVEPPGSARSAAFATSSLRWNAPHSPTMPTSRPLLPTPAMRSNATRCVYRDAVKEPGDLRAALAQTIVGQESVVESLVACSAVQRPRAARRAAGICENARMPRVGRRA